MFEVRSALGLVVHRPLGPRKSGMPESVEMPAPVSTVDPSSPRHQPDGGLHGFGVRGHRRHRIEPSRPVAVAAGPASDEHGDVPTPNPIDRVLGAIVPRAVGAIDMDHVVGEVDIDHVVSEVDIDKVVSRVDVDAVISRVDVNAVVERVDIEALLGRVDIGGLIKRVDLDEVLANVDLDALLERLDLDAVLERIDMDKLLAKVDLDPVLEPRRPRPGAGPTSTSTPCSSGWTWPPWPSGPGSTTS